MLSPLRPPLRLITRIGHGSISILETLPSWANVCVARYVRSQGAGVSGKNIAFSFLTLTPLHTLHPTPYLQATEAMKP